MAIILFINGYIVVQMVARCVSENMASQKKIRARRPSQQRWTMLERVCTPGQPAIISGNHQKDGEIIFLLARSIRYKLN